MIREAKEEAGIQIERTDMIPVQVMHRKKSDEERIDYFFSAHKWTGSIINMEPHKCDELKWFNIRALPSNIVPYVRYGIEKYIEKANFTLFGWD